MSLEDHEPFPFFQELLRKFRADAPKRVHTCHSKKPPRKEKPSKLLQANLWDAVGSVWCQRCSWTKPDPVSPTLFK